MAILKLVDRFSYRILYLVFEKNNILDRHNKMLL